MTKTKQSVQRSTRKAAPSAANPVRTHMVVKMLDLASIVPYKRNPRKRNPPVWTIPSARMKAKRPHRVPLPERTTEILEAARTRGDGPLVFPGRDGAPLADKRLRRLLQQQGIAAVPHGFRSTFRDWAAEETDHPREVIEAALAHVVQNKVRSGPMPARTCSSAGGGSWATGRPI